jgi:hypothetical protein
MSRYEDMPYQEFHDYIPWQRDDAKAVRVNCRPKFDVTVSGIALPLYPAPAHSIVYVLCDWMPAVYWRKHAMFNHRQNSDWTVWRVHQSRISHIVDLEFRMNEWGHYHYNIRGGNDLHHDLFPHIEGWWSVEDSYVKTIRSWTLNGWYVKDSAMPVCYHTQPDHLPPLFSYQDCIPLQGAKALERRMKMLIPDWQPDFSHAGLEYREAHPNASRDDVEIAASEFCEQYDYFDFMGVPFQPSQKASAWLYAVFCASAGYLV